MPPLTGAKGKHAKDAEGRLDRRAGGEQEGGVQAEVSIQRGVREDSGKEQCGGARRGLQGPELAGGSE